MEMPTNPMRRRSPCVTIRGDSVARRAGWATSLLGCALIVLLQTGLSKRPAHAEEGGSLSPRDALLTALGERHKPAARLQAAARVLAGDALADAGLAFEAGVSLLPVDVATGGWLVHRALEMEQPLDEAVANAQEVVSRLEGSASDPTLAAVRFRLGLRTPEVVDALCSVWPPQGLAHAVLAADVGTIRVDELPLVACNQAVAKRTLQALLPALRALDEASRLAPETLCRGLDALVGPLKDAAPAVCLHELRRARARPGIDGRTPRACRAAMVLGLIQEATARPLLEEALRGDDGWLRHAAATALGDLGDPGAAPALAWHLSVLSDAFRNRDRWGYPGPDGTPISREAWQRTDYFVVDAAAACSLLRLGVPGAAGWLIHRQLDPRIARFRIRVLQDARDALVRYAPGAPARAYNVDSGVPQRKAAFEALAAWWHEKRSQRDVLPLTLDETDVRFQEAARGLAQHLREDDARRFIISKAACRLLGACMTPALLDALAQSARPVAKCELAIALGEGRDPRAVPALLSLLRDASPTVRARATRALAAHVGTLDEVRTAVLARRGDPSEDVQAAAWQALVEAPPHPSVAEALGTPPDDRDALRAFTVVCVVQRGDEASQQAVLAGLAEPTRESRHAWWDLVRRALNLPPHVHNAQPAPDQRGVRRLQAQRLRAEVARVRGER